MAVAIVMVYMLYRWFSARGTNEATAGGATGSSSSAATGVNTAATLGFRPRNVTPEMVQTVASMFPDIPEDNIRFDLLRTGNAERTVNTVLEKGFLPPPPPTYVRPAGSQPAARPQRAPASAAATGSSSSPSAPNLISRFHLEKRLSDPNISDQPAGKGTWENTPEGRQANLAERKAQMILAARKRLLEKQGKTAA